MTALRVLLDGVISTAVGSFQCSRLKLKAWGKCRLGSDPIQKPQAPVLRGQRNPGSHAFLSRPPPQLALLSLPCACSRSFCRSALSQTSLTAAAAQRHLDSYFSDIPKNAPLQTSTSQKRSRLFRAEIVQVMASDVCLCVFLV